MEEDWGTDPSGFHLQGWLVPWSGYVMEDTPINSGDTQAMPGLGALDSTEGGLRLNRQRVMVVMLAASFSRGGYP